jgi:hypothetical protein
MLRLAGRRGDGDDVREKSIGGERGRDGGGR